MFTFPDETAAALRARFAQEGYVRLPGLVGPDLLARLGAEAGRLAAIGQRRDFAMACTDDSPRHMTALGGHLIAEHSPLITGLYTDPTLMSFLQNLTAGPVIAPPHVLERHVLNILHRPGDTHGAHTDDYPYALVLFIEAPEDPAAGGLLEYAPHTGDLGALERHGVRRAHHRRGDAYVLRADTTAHRVTALTKTGRRRTVLNFAYTTPEERTTVTPSAALLYGGPHQER
ncbi:hypothetical protein GCM10010302_06610 [Streptomyces polychromogenes]|uniref:Fe2OG dioxygenase domain-containing protein n=1 Tax=Streptomyces polychromogenes TaxID=67342 RepID=A0ABN0V2A4_9ACTN